MLCISLQSQNGTALTSLPEHTPWGVDLAVMDTAARVTLTQAERGRWSGVQMEIHPRPWQRQMHPRSDCGKGYGQWLMRSYAPH